MNPLLFTLTFLSLIGILTSSELSKRGFDQMNTYSLTSSKQMEVAKDNALQKALFDDLKCETMPVSKPRLKKSPKVTKKSPAARKLRFDIHRPPNNARLNLYSVIQEEDPILKQTVVRLLHTLYNKSATYSQDTPERLIHRLIELKDLSKEFGCEEQLSTLDLQNEDLQAFFYEILKGGVSGDSLLHYIHYQPSSNRSQRKINILFAPEALLDAFFESKLAADSVKQAVQSCWETINTYQSDINSHDSLTRTHIRQQLSAQFDQLLSKADLDADLYRKYFDFTLGKPGDILIIEEPKSGKIIRQRVLPKA